MGRSYHESRLLQCLEMAMPFSVMVAMEPYGQGFGDRKQDKITDVIALYIILWNDEERKIKR